MATQLSNLTPDLVDRRYPKVEIDLTKEWVELFFRSMGHERDLTKQIPLSFYSCLKKAEFDLFAALNIELKQLLHVTQSFEYHKPLKIGDKISSQVSIKRINHRKLGEEHVVFMELINEFRMGEELLAYSNGSVLVREVKS